MSHCCLIEVDKVHRLFFFRFCQHFFSTKLFTGRIGITNLIGVGIWYPSPPKKKWQRLWQKTWENLGWINLNLKFEKLKISHNWRYTAVHMSKCWWTSVVVMWFFGHPPGGKDAIYRYPGSHCYGLLRKRQNGGRPEAQEGPKDTTSWAGCGFLSTLFAKMANQPTPP